jgi:hypothetical protein
VWFITIPFPHPSETSWSDAKHPTRKLINFPFS